MKNVNMAEARKQMGVTMDQVSAATGINTNRLYGLEWGRLRAKPTEARIIASALGREIEDLFPDGMQGGRTR